MDSGLFQDDFARSIQSSLVPCVLQMMPRSDQQFFLTVLRRAYVGLNHFHYI